MADTVRSAGKSTILHYDARLCESSRTRLIDTITAVSCMLPLLFPVPRSRESSLASTSRSRRRSAVGPSTIPWQGSLAGRSNRPR